MVIHKALVNRSTGKIYGVPQVISDFYPALRPDGDAHILRYLWFSQFEQIVKYRKLEFKRIDLFKGALKENGQYEGDEKEGLINDECRSKDEIKFDASNKIKNEDPNESYENRRPIGFANCWRLSKSAELEIWPKYRNDINNSVVVVTKVNSLLSSIGLNKFPYFSKTTNREKHEYLHHNADAVLNLAHTRNPFYLRKVRYYSKQDAVTEHFVWAAFHKRKNEFEWEKEVRLFVQHDWISVMHNKQRIENWKEQRACGIEGLLVDLLQPLQISSVWIRKEATSEHKKEIEMTLMQAGYSEDWIKKNLKNI